MKKGIEAAAHLHEKVPSGWYFKSLKAGPAKWYWYPQYFQQLKYLKFQKMEVQEFLKKLQE